MKVWYAVGIKYTERCVQMKKVNSKLIVLAVVLILFFIGYAISESNKQADSLAFSQQLKKDPNTWSSQEKSRYNSFSNWSSTQKK